MEGWRVLKGLQICQHDYSQGCCSLVPKRENKKKTQSLEEKTQIGQKPNKQNYEFYKIVVYPLVGHQSYVV